VGVVIAVLSIFSTHLTESIKFSINKADLRSKSYEELSGDLSEYVFASKLCAENIERNMTTREGKAATPGLTPSLVQQQPATNPVPTASSGPETKKEQDSTQTSRSA
jgi:hypothetical protein